MAIDWATVWVDTAVRLRRDVDAGLGHLLTEDAVRWRVIESLVRAGVSGTRIEAEVPAKALRGGMLDLVVDRRNVVELKYPRLLRVTNAPLTQILGSLLRDFQRVGAVDASERWVVQVYPAAVEAYLVRLGERVGIAWPTVPAAGLEITPGLMASLPATVGPGIRDAPSCVVATCRVHERISRDLSLYAFTVN
jgi:hypothetical protein